MPRVLLPLLLVVPLVVGGCERPFIEPEAPTLELLRPTDLSVIRAQPELPLAFRASTAFGAVSRVEVNGERTTYTSDQNVYLDTLRLDEGANRIVVEAFGAEGTIGADTLFALYLPAALADLPAVQLSTPLGGHAAVRLSDGSVLITGGAGSLGGAARDGALRFQPATFSFETLSARMQAARAGHAASLLSDGRVLITGGTRTATPPSALGDFVTTVELYDPALDTFTEVPVVAGYDGAVRPVQRTDHTVTVLRESDGAVSVYLYGGIANLGTDADPFLGPSEFMRRLRFVDDADGPRLVAPDPGSGFRFTAIAGHTQTPLSDVGPDGLGHYLVAGTTDLNEPAEQAPFELSFAPSALDVAEVGRLVQPRSRHAAARFFDDLVLLIGGESTDATGGGLLVSGEVFAEEARRFFHFGDEVRLTAPRQDHTATNIGGGRILIVGGFSSSGQALTRTDLFVASP